MVSRRESALVAFIVVGSVFATAEAVILEPCALNPQRLGTCLGGLSFPSIIFLYFVGVLPVIFTSYAAYWAFRTRRALASRIYRNQALGVGLVGISLTVLFLLSGITFSFGPSTLTFPELFLLNSVPAVVTFYWIDTSMQTARRADPLLRSSSKWLKLRLVLWGVLVAAISAQSILTLQLFLSGVQSSPLTNIGSPALPPFVLALWSSALTVFISGISAAVFLIPAARKAGDNTLRSHLKWFGLGAFLIFFFLYGAPPLVSTPLMEVGGYFLYRSAKSLATLNKLLPSS